MFQESIINNQPETALRVNKLGKQYKVYTKEEENRIIEKVTEASKLGIPKSDVVKILSDEMGVTGKAIEQKYYVLAKDDSIATRSKVSLNDDEVLLITKMIVEKRSQGYSLKNIFDLLSSEMGYSTNTISSKYYSTIKGHEKEIINASAIVQPASEVVEGVKEELSAKDLIAGLKAMKQERDDYKSKYEDLLKQLNNLLA